MSIYVPPCKPAQQVGPEFAVAETLMVLVTGANATARGAFSGSAGKLSHRQWIATRTFDTSGSIWVCRTICAYGTTTPYGRTRCSWPCTCSNVRVSLRREPVFRTRIFASCRHGASSSDEEIHPAYDRLMGIWLTPAAESIQSIVRDDIACASLYTCM
jgi:hypothetical protein